MKSNQDKKQHDKQHGKFSMVIIMVSIMFLCLSDYGLSLGHWFQGEPQLKEGAHLVHTPWFGKFVWRYCEPSILCTVCAQIVLDSHKHCLLILTLAA